MTFPNLHTVDLSRAFFNMHDSLDRSYATELISLNPSLVNICVCRPNPTSDIQFWNAVSNLQHLKSIRTISLALHEDEMEAFWKALSKLEDANLDIDVFPMDYQQSSSMFYRMRKMNLAANKSDSAVQLQIIQSCPNIEDLIWRVRIENEERDQFASDMEHGLWPKLEVIELGYRDDEYSSRILNSMHRATKISNCGDFGPLSFQSLQRHFSTLTHVSLAHCRAVASVFVQEILCSCPLLVDFAADTLDAKYIENRRPWVCLSMKKLRLCFVFAKSEGNLQPLAFKFLSTLTHLLQVDIGGLGYYRTSIPTEARLDVRLKSGLGLLSSWKNIREFNLCRTTQSMGEADIQWIISNWHRIERIYGDLNQDSQVNTNLRAILQAQGIKGYEQD